jgi:hypothetical protein
VAARRQASPHQLTEATIENKTAGDAGFFVTPTPSSVIRREEKQTASNRSSEAAVDISQ